MGFWDGALDLVGSVAGAYLSSNAADNAAQVQANASNNAAQVQQNMYNQSREDAAPYRDVGQNALYHQAALYGLDYEGAPGTVEDRYETAMNRFKETPSYQFRVSEGINALDNSAASRGRLRSGAQDQAITKFGQNVASTEFGDYTNRLAALSGNAQTATQSLASVGQNTAANIGNATMAAGNAQATGIANKNNALQDGITNFMKSWK